MGHMREGDLHYEQYSKNENRYSCGKPWLFSGKSVSEQKKSTCRCIRCKVWCSRHIRVSCMYRGERNTYGTGTWGHKGSRLQCTLCLPWKLWTGDFRDSSCKALWRTKDVCCSSRGDTGELNSGTWRCILWYVKRKLQSGTQKYRSVYSGVSCGRCRWLRRYDTWIPANSKGYIRT